jgi:hypothetical protein
LEYSRGDYLFCHFILLLIVGLKLFIDDTY